MTLQETFNYLIELVNNNPVKAIMLLISILELAIRNIKSDRNLSIVQNVIKWLTFVAQALDKVAPNKTATPNVVYTTEVSVNRVEVKTTIEPEKSIS